MGVVPLFIATLNDQQHQLTAFALFFAFLWGTVFKYFVVRKSGNWIVCIAAMFAGVVVTILLLLVYATLFPKFVLSLVDSQFAVVRLLAYVFQVGVCEETSKVIPVIIYLVWMKKKAAPRTTVLIGVFSGLGFAAIENMGYGYAFVDTSLALTQQYGAEGLEAGVRLAMLKILLRSLSLVFCHGLWTGIVAYFLAVGNLTGKKRVALSASLAESVGEFRLGKFAKGVKQDDFDALFGAKAIGLSHGQFGFVVKALHNAR